ncbi:MAG: threonylcarbamoyl-AMP synthase [Lachnospiraceae bacterium]|nr:threonylcarbamoyl-AMP synthase [Lachnospiraceae bacterium]
MLQTKIIKVSGESASPTPRQEEAIRCAGEILRQGGLVAFPTETVYGLGGDALNKDSSRKIYEAKGRPSDNPLIVHIYRMEDLPVVAQVNDAAVKIAEAFWPGPLTMILPKTERVPAETTGGLGTVAVRMPSHPVAQKLIACAGGFVAAPSANASGKPSPTLAKYVAEDMMGKIEMILDGGEVGIGLESTIIDLTVSPPQILRPGYITEAMLQQVLEEVDTDVTILDENSGQAPRAPGMKYRHYAPKGELTIVTGDAEKVVEYINLHAKQNSMSGEKVGVIATEETLHCYQAQVVKSVGSRMDESSIAHHLYRVLRELDDEQVTCIYSEGFTAEGFGQAIMNRLLKAAGHKVITLE